MIQVSFPAMGTKVLVVAPDPETVSSVEMVFWVVESICTRFDPNSELSRSNDSDETEVQVSPLLAEVMGWAETIRIRTSGLIDPAVGERVKAWGYDRTFAEVTGGDFPPPMGDVPEWRVDGNVLHRDPDLCLDLGGIAKGWTCDLAVQVSEASVVNAGGDIRSVDPDLVVAVKDPWDDPVAKVRLGDGGLATSTVAHRAWRVGDGWANHLIDPRTRRPVESPVLTATAVADTAVEAEAGAKAVLLLGEEGLAWASEQDWLRGALVIWRDLRVFATPGLEYVA